MQMSSVHIIPMILCWCLICLAGFKEEYDREHCTNYHRAQAHGELMTRLTCNHPSSLVAPPPVLALLLFTYCFKITEANFCFDTRKTLDYFVVWQLEKQHSPLLKDLMYCLKEVMKDYRSEVQDVLSADRQLANEIEFDLKRFEEQQKELLEEQRRKQNTPNNSSQVCHLHVFFFCKWEFSVSM